MGAIKKDGFGSDLHIVFNHDPALRWDESLMADRDLAGCECVVGEHNVNARGYTIATAKDASGIEVAELPHDNVTVTPDEADDYLVLNLRMLANDEAVAAT